MNDNNRQILQWKKHFSLTQPDIAKITGYSMSSVKKWFLEESSKDYKITPDNAIRLFMYWMDNPNTKETEAQKAIILNFSNQKGGCGKTTLSLNFSKMLAKRGEKVLVIDNDTQGNLSYSLLRDQYPPKDSSTLIHLGKDVEPIEIENNLFCVGADENLVDIEKKTAVEVFFNLRNGISNLIKKYGFTYVIIDSPPSLGTVFIAGLIASNYVVVPVYPEVYHMQGLIALMQKIKIAQQPGLAINLKVAGIIINRANINTIITKNIINQLTESFPGLVFDNIISNSTAIIESQMPMFSNSIEEYHKIEKRKSEKVKIEFEKVLEELIKRVNE